MTNEYKEEYIDPTVFTPKTIPWLNDTKVDAEVSVDNIPESEFPTTDYFVWTISFSASTSVTTTATIASTTKVSDPALVSGNTIVIQKEWIYQINVSCSWAWSSSWVRKIYIYKNNIRFDAWGDTQSWTSQELTQISTWDYLYVWDIIDIRVFQNSWWTLASQLDANKFSVLQIS